MPTGWTPAAGSSTFEEWTCTFSRWQHCSCFRTRIRFVELGVCLIQLFKIFLNCLITSWKSDDFSLRLVIYRFSKWRPSAILELFYHHTRPLAKFLLLAAAACEISCQYDTQIWRYSCLNFSHIWQEMPIQVPKIGVLGEFGPLTVIIHHRDPQKAHPCVNLRLLSYQL